MRRTHTLAPAFTAAALALTAALMAAPLWTGCGGGEPVFPTEATADELSGLVVKGPVANGLVTAYRVDGEFQRGEALGSGTTDEGGAFSVGIPSYVGPILLVASTGTYLEEAVGAEVKLDGQELVALLPGHKPNADAAPVLITPISHLAAQLALFWARTEGKELPLALEEAHLHLDSHFGALEWRKVVPGNLTVPGGSQLDPAAKAGLLLAGLSMQARTISEAAGLTPGGVVTALTLLSALTEDLSADGHFDGVGPQGELLLPRGGQSPGAYRLDGQTVRVALGQAVARFLQSERNATSLVFADAQQLVRDLSRNSNPRLFRTAGEEFDNKPPQVSFRATFVASDATTLEAVGPSRLVARMLTVTAEALDDSVITSLSVAVGGTPVPATGQGNSPTHFQGTWQTQGDGPLVFTATATDLWENSGTTEYVVTADNSAPLLDVKKPQAGFCSTTLDVEATAVDANGLASFVVEGLDGFVDQDAAQGRLFGTWTIPTLPDGALNPRFVACDLVHNCESQTIPSTIDRSAPTLALVGASTHYTNAATVALSVMADDGNGAGVKTVWARSGGASPIQGFSSGGNWSFPAIPLDMGKNTIKVWAEDLASPANSGQGSSTPTELSLEVVRDSSAPSVFLAGQASYFDEQGANFQRKADGTPKMPVAYDYAGTTREDISNLTNYAIHKLATRLSAGPTAPTAAELEGANPYNVPFLQVSIPFDAAQEAPLTSVTYSVAVGNCSPCGTATTSTGPALPSPRSAGNSLYFDIPIALETLPQLRYASSSPGMGLTISLLATDAAGNTSTTTLASKNYFVHPPPVAWVRDTAYEGRADPKSAFAYRLANQTYDSLFDPNNANFAQDNYLRLARFIAYNPSEVPVAVQVLSAGGAVNFELRESWGGQSYAVAGNSSDNYAVDGFSFQVGRLWDANPGSTVGSDCPDPAFNFPCGAGNRDSSFPYHRVGNSAVQYTCSALPAPPYAPSASTAAYVGMTVVNPGFRAFTSPNAQANETTAATALGGSFNRWVIPAAVNGVPGALAIYVGGTRPTNRSRPLTWQSNPFEPTSRYQYWHADYWKLTAQNGYCCKAWSESCVAEYRLYRWYEYLSAAEVRNNNGLLDVWTSGLFDTGGGSYLDVGANQRYLTSYPFTLQFSN